MRWFEYQNTSFQFLNNVEKEVGRAREKFPEGKRLLGALMEEVGEAAQALLKIEEDGGDPQNVYDELVQVAAMALRLAVEGEPDYGYAGTKCHYAGCTQNAHGRPCAICYE